MRELIAAILISAAAIAAIVTDAGAQNHDDRLARTSDGRVVQAEYIAFYERHKHDPRLTIIEDDYSVVLAQCTPGAVQTCVLIGPDYRVHVITRR